MTVTATRPDGEDGFGSVRRDGVLCAGRNLRRLSRSPVTVVQSVAFPSLLLVVLLIAFGRVIGGTVEAYAGRLVPQLVVAAGAFGATGTGLAVFADRRNGMIERLRSLPIASSSFLVGTVTADAARALLAAVAMVAIGHLPGFRFSTGVVGVVGFFALAVVFGTVWAWAAINLGLWARTAESVSSLMSGPVLMLFFLSTGFVPADGFPSAVQPLVRANPLSCAVNALIGLSRGGPTLVPVLQTLAWTLALSALLAPAAIRRYRAGT
jgi:ABC transporter DrrB family efflux protein